MPATDTWKDKASFLAPACIKSKVGDKDEDFYPMSIHLLFRLRKLSSGIASALSVLFADTSKDTAAEDRTIKNADGTIEGITSTTAVDLNLAKFRAEQRTKGVQQFIDSLLAESNEELVGEIIMDSLRNVFDPAQRRAWPIPQDFLKDTPATRLPDLLTGVARANKGIFDPLTAKLGGLVEQLTKAVGQKIENKLVTETPLKEVLSEAATSG